MKRLVCIAFVATVVLCGCAQDTHDLMVTEKNKDTIFQQIKDSKDLTVEEVGLLQAHAIRNGLKNAFSGTKSDGMLEVGKTLRQIILDEKGLQAEQKLKDEQDKIARDKLEAQEKQDREAALAKEAAQLKAINDRLSVTVVSKGFRPRDEDAYELQDYITLKLSYKNKTKMVIRGFKGNVVFKNLFGDTVKGLTLEEDDPIPANSSVSAARQIDFNKYMESDQKLASTELENLKVEWRPKAVIFANGSTLTTE